MLLRLLGPRFGKPQTRIAVGDSSMDNEKLLKKCIHHHTEYLDTTTIPNLNVLVGGM